MSFVYMIRVYLLQVRMGSLSDVVLVGTLVIQFIEKEMIYNEHFSIQHKCKKNFRDYLNF